MESAEKELENSIHENNFQVKLRLHQIQDQIAHGEYSVTEEEGNSSRSSNSSNGSSSISAMSLQIARLKEQLYLSDENLQKLGQIQGINDGKSFDEIQRKYERMKLTDDTIAADGEIQSEEDNMEKKHGGNVELLNGIVTNLPEMGNGANIEDKNIPHDQINGADENKENMEYPKNEWIQASPKKSIARWLDNVTPGIFKDSKKTSGASATIETEKQNSDLQQLDPNYYEQQNKHNQAADFDELEAFNISIEPNMSPMKMSPEKPSQRIGPAPLQHQPKDAFDTSNMPSLHGFSPLRPEVQNNETKKAANPKNQSELNTQDPIQNKLETLDREPHMQPLPQTEVHMHGRPTSTTHYPPRLQTPKRDDDGRFKVDDDNESISESVESVDRAGFSVNGRANANANGTGTGGDPSESTKFFDPFTMDAEFDITQSLVSENKSLRLELNSKQQSDLQLQRQLAELQRQNETMKEQLDSAQNQLIAQEILTYSNDRLRAQRNDLAFLYHYQQEHLKTFHTVSKTRLSLLQQMGVIDIHDEESAYRIISPNKKQILYGHNHHIRDRLPFRNALNSNNTRIHNRDRDHLYRQNNNNDFGRPRASFRGTAWAVVSAIRLRNRLREANRRIALMREKTAELNSRSRRG